MLGNPHYDDIFKLCDIVRETSFAIHNYLRSVQIGKIYENALAHRLRKLGIAAYQKYPLQVLDQDGAGIGKLEIDLIIDNQLIVEVKACRRLVDEHIAQLLGYLRACRFEHGLLINFGGPKLQVKKYVLSRELGL
jgi:GxxExxY protein